MCVINREKYLLQICPRMFAPVEGYLTLPCWKCAIPFRGPILTLAGKVEFKILLLVDFVACDECLIFAAKCVAIDTADLFYEN